MEILLSPVLFLLLVFYTCWDFSLSDFFCLTCDSSLSVVVVVLATPLRAMIMETTAGDLLHLGCTSFPFITVLLRSVCSPYGEVYVLHRPRQTTSRVYSCILSLNVN